MHIRKKIFQTDIWIRKIGWIAALLVVAFDLTYGQEETPSATPPLEAPADPSAASDTASEDDGIDIEEGTLIRSTLANDVRTSSFYELVAWLEELELSTRGGRNELETRLYEHFGVEVSAIPEAAVNTELEIVIDSAIQSDYFTIDEIDQQYIRLSGGVQMTIRDGDDTHTIAAEQFIFNQQENTMTATGDIVYTIERPNTTEKFLGNTITIDLDTWEGFFLEGLSRRNIPTGGGRVSDYYFSGDVISRSRDDVIILKDGTVTSSPIDPPYYHLRASKIWILSPGDWGMEGATLYIGKVPVFYFPYFFNPGADLFFNPVFGYRDREGFYMQTTTYLLGKKQGANSGFSFLQTTDKENTELRGLFLQPAPAPEEEPKDYGTLRLLADVYSTLGVYLGLDGTLQGLPVFNSVNIVLGLAATQHIYRAGSQYTSFRQENGKIVNSWVETNFFGVRIPFRYFIEASTGISLNAANLSFNFNFEFYSDPYILTDYGTRSENINWLDLIENRFPSASARDKTSLSWRLNGSWRPSVSILSPYINRFSIDNLAFQMNWQSKNITANLLRPEARSAINSPERRFFFPHSIVYPSVDFTIAGNLVNFSSNNIRSQSTDALSSSDPPLQILRPPWEQESTLEHRDDETALKIPSLNGALAGSSSSSLVSFSLGYVLDPQFLLQGYFDSDKWTEPSTINLNQFKYSSIIVSNDLKLNYNFQVLGQFFSLAGSVDAAGKYQDHFNDSSLASAERSALVQKNQQYNSVAITNTVNTSIRPLWFLPILSSSSINHNIKFKIYELRFDGVSNSYLHKTIEWNKDFITAHSLRASLGLNLLGTTQTLTLQIELPPLEEKLSGNLALSLGFITANISSGLKMNNEKWEFDPLNINLGLNFDTNFRIQNRLSINIEDTHVQTLSTSINLWVLHVNFLAQHVTGYRFASNFVALNLAEPWQADDQIQFRPVSLSLSINPNYTSPPLWHNRIKISFAVPISLSLDFQRFTGSSISISPSFSFSVEKFVNLSLQLRINNNFIYQYIPALAQLVNRQPRNFFQDVIDSINFFDEAARRRSFFKLQTLSISLSFDLVDWQLSIQYNGGPELTGVENARQYQWQQEIAINLVWHPIPEFDTNVKIDKDGKVTIEE